VLEGRAGIGGIRWPSKVLCGSCAALYNQGLVQRNLKREAGRQAGMQERCTLGAGRAYKRSQRRRASGSRW